jgi:hypothetical protein
MMVDEKPPAGEGYERKIQDMAEIRVSIFRPHRSIVGDGIFARPDWSQHRVQGNGRL